MLGRREETRLRNVSRCHPYALTYCDACLPLAHKNIYFVLVLVLLTGHLFAFTAMDTGKALPKGGQAHWGGGTSCCEGV